MVETEIYIIIRSSGSSLLCTKQQTLPDCGYTVKCTITNQSDRFKINEQVFSGIKADVRMKTNI